VSDLEQNFYAAKTGGASGNLPQHKHGLSPVEALKRVHEVLADKTMSHAARNATAAVVLCADNKTGCAWPGYRWIARTFGVSYDAIRAALAVPGGQAIGKHLEAAGHGPRGVQRYRVLPVPEDPEAGSAPAAGAQAAGQRTNSDVSAHRSGRFSAPVLTDQRTADGSVTNVELTYETSGENCPAPLPVAHGEDRNTLADADARLVGYLEATTGQPSNGQARAFLGAVQEARQAGATDAMIAHAILQQSAGATPWTGPNSARDAARALIADYSRNIGFDNRPPTLQTILGTVRGCAAAERRAAAGESLENPCGVASVRQWAARNSKALADAETWPDLGLTAAPPKVHLAQ
jgi:hypothetical protein